MRAGLVVLRMAKPKQMKGIPISKAPTYIPERIPGNVFRSEIGRAHV